MTQDTRTIENKLRWSQDQQSANAVIQSNKAVGSSLGEIRKQADIAYEAQVKQLTDLKQRQTDYFKSVRQAADAAYDAAVKQASAPAPRAGLLSHIDDDQRIANKFIEDLTQIQAAEADVGQQAVVAAEKVGMLTQRLAEADKARASAGDSTGGLRDLAFGAGADTGAATGGGVSAGGVLGNLRQAAIALPGIGFQSPLVIALHAAEKAADATGASLAQLGVAGGITAAVIIAIKLAADAFNKTLEGGKNRLAAALTAQQNYYDALQNSTTAQVKATVATLEHNQAVLKQQIDETSDAIRSAQTVKASSLPQLFFDLIVKRSTELIGATGDLTKRQDDLKQQYQAQEDTITRLKQGLEGGAFATNDAIEAEKALQKAREESASQLIAAFDQEANSRVQLAALRRTGTVDQVNAELDANKDRETIIRNFLLPAVASLGLTTDAASKRTQELNTELDNLQHNDKLLVDAVLPVVAQREAEVNLLKAQKDASDALNPILQDINKSQVDLGQASEKTAAALAAVGQAETEHAAKLVDIQTTYDDATTSALQKKNEQLAKIDANAAQRTLEQRENLNLQVEGLVARGQIAEAQQAIRAQRLKETQDARQIQTQKDDAQKAYNDQLKAANVQREKLLKSEQERYSKELQQRRDAYDQAVRDQQFLFNRIKSLRDQEQLYTRYWISAQVNALYQVQDATGTFAANMKSYADQINANIQAGGAAWHPAPAGSSGTGVVSTPGAGPGGLPPVTGTAALRGRATPTAFDTPSFNRYPGLYISRVPEYHIPVADFNRMSGVGGTSLTFNVGDGGAELAQKIVTALKPVLDKHGEGIKVQVTQDLAAIHANQKKGISQ